MDSQDCISRIGLYKSYIKLLYYHVEHCIIFPTILYDWRGFMFGKNQWLKTKLIGEYQQQEKCIEIPSNCTFKYEKIGKWYAELKEKLLMGNVADSDLKDCLIYVQFPFTPKFREEWGFMLVDWYKSTQGESKQNPGEPPEDYVVDGIYQLGKWFHKVKTKDNYQRELLSALTVNRDLYIDYDKDFLFELYKHVLTECGIDENYLSAINQLEYFCKELVSYRKLINDTDIPKTINARRRKRCDALLKEIITIWNNAGRKPAVSEEKMETITNINKIVLGEESLLDLSYDSYIEEYNQEEGTFRCILRMNESIPREAWEFIFSERSEPFFRLAKDEARKVRAEMQAKLIAEDGIKAEENGFTNDGIVIDLQLGLFCVVKVDKYTTLTIPIAIHSNF